MKLRFEPDLDFQLLAIEAVCDLYRLDAVDAYQRKLVKPSTTGIAAN
jgi:hypothetical protein